MTSLPSLSGSPLGKKLVFSSSSASDGRASIGLTSSSARSHLASSGHEEPSVLRDTEVSKAVESLLGKRNRALFEGDSFQSISHGVDRHAGHGAASLPSKIAVAGAGAPVLVVRSPLSPARNPFMGTPPSSPKAASGSKVAKMPPVFKPVRAITSVFAQKALKIMEEGCIKKADGTEVKIIPIPGASGQHSQVYSLAGAPNFLDETDNSRLVVKIFKEDMILSSTSHTIDSYVRTSLRQYEELSDAKLPIVKIYNHKTAKDDGFLLVERVRPLKMPWEIDTTREKLDDEHKELLEQIKFFFDFASKSLSTIPLDLNADNFGLNREGRVVLLDFMEHEEDLDDPSIPGAAFSLIRNSCIEKISKGNPTVRGFLES